MKKSTKEFKPTYVVNIDEIEYLEDIPSVWALAKQDAGLPLTDEELTDICVRVCREMRPIITVVGCNCDCVTKKEPWYKRFWNWLTRKK